MMGFPPSSVRRTVGMTGGRAASGEPTVGRRDELRWWILEARADEGAILLVVGVVGRMDERRGEVGRSTMAGTRGGEGARREGGTMRVRATKRAKGEGEKRRRRRRVRRERLLMVHLCAGYKTGRRVGE